MAQITVTYQNFPSVTIPSASSLPLVLGSTGYLHNGKKVVNLDFALQGVDKATVNVSLSLPLPPSQKLAVPYRAGLPTPVEATWTTTSAGVATVEINPQPGQTVNAMLEGLGQTAGINVTD
jgi:hypothetical protein